jgi:nickel-dependent lactate racemase
MRVSIPYGTSALSCDIPDSRLKAVLVSSLHELKADAPERQIVRKSLENPIGSLGLRELAEGKKNVVIISSDHTRPVPSAIIMPLLLEEVRAGNPDAEITILVSTGGHRATTPGELLKKYGTEIVKNERIVVHDSHDDASLVHVGTLPSGGDLILNKLAVEADLLVAEGFIEPHFFAGFSGGRKSVLPGVASYTTVMANHCAEFIAHERARTGIIEGNPIHGDMVFAARKVGLAFVCNVVIDAEKHIAAAFSGDMEAAHEEGCAFVGKYGRVKAVPADIVVTSNAGYPLDQNLYQAVKSMTAGEASCTKGGVIIVAAECSDGHGGEAFYRTFETIPTPKGIMDMIMARGRNQTEPDQWQIQIFARVLMDFTVIMVTSAPKEMAEHLNMQWAPSLEEALSMAERILGKPDASVTVIPDGVAVIVDAFSS